MFSQLDKIVFNSSLFLYFGLLCRIVLTPSKFNSDIPYKKEREKLFYVLKIIDVIIEKRTHYMLPYCLCVSELFEPISFVSKV